LEKHPTIEAIFFGNDDLAAGALFECQRRGIKVPEQLAIMGFNDQEISRSTIPAITSVWTPRLETGQLAAQMLLEALHGRTPAERRVDLGFKIIQRESSNRERNN